MPDCDGFFNDAGIPFEPPFQDAAVRAVWTADFYDPIYKKWLIRCWFDTTYGAIENGRFDRRTSPDEMKAWLRANKYVSFEQFLETEPYATNQENKPRV